MNLVILGFNSCVERRNNVEKEILKRKDIEGLGEG